ncbi:unnamed protein product [Ceutorhynchus assimilis]|uniref:Uncharacterized protein n=1 Tax=Ceutorhynchus assimilis TaxID=467358 RepID=A0A9N9MYB6_9CUCU|nr:unnamed protein product [Ceutorhynchus assimilis]
MFSYNTIIAFIVILINTISHSENSTILFNSGWYKTKKKSDKTLVHNVTSIGPNSFDYKASYLKISSVISILPKSSIHDLINLQDLIISSSGIINIEAGVFENVPKLSKVNLKENGIQQIRYGVFNGLNLTMLFLNKNEISFIDGGAFDDMPKLTKIKLNFNQISTWDCKWFKRTPALNVVSIRRNSIKEIPDGAFKNLNNEDLKLFLSKNNIVEIHPSAFSGIKRISQLYLDRNKLTQLDDKVFDKIEHIHTLSLARNNLTEIPKKLLKTVKYMRYLDLTANHRLQCVPIEVARIVQTIKLENVLSLNCSCIASLRNVTHVIGVGNLCKQ